MLLNVDAFLPSLLELFEDPLRAIELRRFALELHPAFARGDFHAERIFQRFQEFEIVRIKRLDRARALELQRARFSHFGAKPRALIILSGRKVSNHACVHAGRMGMA